MRILFAMAMARFILSYPVDMTPFTTATGNATSVYVDIDMGHQVSLIQGRVLVAIEISNKIYRALEA